MVPVEAARPLVLGRTIFFVFAFILSAVPFRRAAIPAGAAKEISMMSESICHRRTRTAWLLFVLAGVAKIAAPQAVLEQMAAHHIPGILLPLVIALELGAGLRWRSAGRLRYAAAALALLRRDRVGIHFLADRIERTLFLKDIAFRCGGPSTGGSDFRIFGRSPRDPPRGQLRGVA